jgi:hypothetical protein
LRNRVILILVLLAVAGGLFFVLRDPAVEPPDQLPAPNASDEVRTQFPVSFDLVRLSREGMGVVAGSAAPGEFVDVMAEGRSIGKSRASGTGSWEIVLSSALDPGTHILSLTATDGEGAEAHSADLAIVAVPPPESETPVKELKTAKGEKKPVADDGVLAVELAKSGVVGRVLQRPGQLKPTLALGLDTADFDASGRTVLTGRAGGGNDVNIYLDGRPVGTARTDDEGRWTTTVKAVTLGPHNIRLEEIDSTDAVVLSIEQAFNPAVTLGIPATNSSAVVTADQAVWHIVRRLGAGPVRYAQIFRADQGVLETDDAVKVPGILKPGSDF